MEAVMKKHRLLLVASSLGIVLYAGCSDDSGTAGPTRSSPNAASSAMLKGGGHEEVTTELQWGPAPPQFPPGALFAVLQGNPSVAGEVFTVRLRMPPGYTIPPHWHPGDEAVTVIRGTFLFGMGDTISDSGWLPPIERGGFVTALRNTNHYVRALSEVDVQVHGIGPSAITYVDPADDPRNQ
jgi:quercetin dioxygenase-like cupin family protein